MKKALLLPLGVLFVLPSIARDFKYTYEGQTLTYTILDEGAKTCQTKEGKYNAPGNNVIGDLILPSIAKDGDTEYTVTTIGKYAFNKCSTLTSTKIPNSVTFIDRYAFTDCSGLTSLEIPSSVTSIGFEAFYNCSGLTSLAIPNSVSSIDNYAFAGCSGLTSLKISDSISYINIGTFSRCFSLTSITIPESVLAIEDSAFSGCANLTSVTIGNSVSTIGENAFAQCYNLTSLDIPNSVHFISKNAFANCYSLTSLIIPDSLLSIGEYAFTNCSNITEIYYKTLYPIETDKNIFDEDIYNTATLYVPINGNDGAYNTFPWSLFVYVEEKDFAGVENIIVDTNKGIIDYNKPYKVYNLQGELISKAIENITRGIYIVRQNRTVKKIAVN